MEGFGFRGWLVIVVLAGAAIGLVAGTVLPNIPGVSSLAAAQQKTQSTPQASSNTRQAGSAAGTPTPSPVAQSASGPQAKGGFGSQSGAVAGRVQQVENNSVTVQTQQGTATVRLTEQTRVEKTAAGTIADLQPGTQVVVQGQAQSSGEITASVITLATGGGQFGQGGQGGQGGFQAKGGQGGQGGFQGKGGQGAFIFGSVQKVEGDTLTIQTQQGTTTVRITDQSRIEKTVAGALTDIQPGVQIVAQGQPSEGGGVTAALVRIVATTGQSQ